MKEELFALPQHLSSPPFFFVGSLSAFSNVYLTIKISTSLRREAYIVELLIHLLSVLITFCLFSEFARNSSFFYLKRVCSVNNTLFLTAVPDRLKCVISLVDYLMLCAVKSLFLCVLIFFSCAIFHIFHSGIQMFSFFVNFSITKLYSSLLLFKIYSKNHYLLNCRKAFISMCFYPEWLSIHLFFTEKSRWRFRYILYLSLKILIFRLFFISMYYICHIHSTLALGENRKCSDD